MASGTILPVHLQEHVEAIIRPLLEARQYDQAAQELQDARWQAEQAHLETFSSLLLVAEEICQLCEHCLREEQHYLDAHQVSLQREAELRQQLLRILSEPTMTNNGSKPFEVPCTVSVAPAVQTMISASRASWWQRLKASVGWGWVKEEEKSEEGKNAGQNGLAPASKATTSNGVSQQEPGVPLNVLPTMVTLQERPETETTATADNIPTITAVEPELNNAHPQVSDSTANEEAAEQASVERPFLMAYCLGTFHLYKNEQLLENWPSRKSKSILKYLLLHRQYPVSKEILMETFWPDFDPEAARNNLNVAIYNLRQTLRNGDAEYSHILFLNDGYLLNPELSIWIDVEAFQQHIHAAEVAIRNGMLPKAIDEFEAAVAHYRGELLAEDRYEEWLLPLRQRLHDECLIALDYLSNYYCEQNNDRLCVATCQEMLALEPAHEAIHRRLIRLYIRQNQRYLALRQYQQCVQILRDELNVAPDPKTTQLIEVILHPK